MRKLITGAILAFTILSTAAGGSPAGAEPNCVQFFEDVFGSEIANHGQHIIGDYITGTGHDGEWPYAGQVGDIVGGRGPANAGAPGIQEHGASPGASFCNGSESPTSPPRPRVTSRANVVASTVMTDRRRQTHDQRGCSEAGPGWITRVTTH